MKDYQTNENKKKSPMSKGMWRKSIEYILRNILAFVVIVFGFFFILSIILNFENLESNHQTNNSFFSDGFQITFPQSPEINEAGTEDVVRIKSYHAIDDKNIEYFVKVGKYDDDFMNSIKSRPAFLEGFLSKFPQNLFVPADKNSAVIFSKRLVFFNKYQGIEYKYKSEIDGNRVYHRGIFFMTDDRSFQVSMNYPEILDTKIDDKYDSFVKSLKLKL